METPIDPRNGMHAAAEVPDEMLEYLYHTVLFELAVRMERHAFESSLRGTLEARAELDDVVDRVRQQRDLMRFAAEVMRDLAAIPVTAEPHPSEPTTGMYL